MKRYPKIILQALLIMAMTAGFCSGVSDAPFGFVEVLRETRLPVPNADRIFAPGESFPLLQDNADFYIVALTEDSMAAAGYNAGPGRPRNWRNGPVLEGAIWAENVPFTETRDYVKKVLSNTTNYAAMITGRPQSLKARLGTVGPKVIG